MPLRELLDPARLQGAIVWGVLALGLTLLGSRAIARVERLARARYPAAPAGAGYLGQLARVLLLLFAFGIYAHWIPGLRSLGTALLASVSVVSIVVGLAAQSTLGNLVAGLTLILYRPFEVGDWLQVNAPGGVATGFVSAVNLGYTELRTADERRVVVPNSVMASQVLFRRPGGAPAATCAASVPVAAPGAVERVREALLARARTLPEVAEVIDCRVTALGPPPVVTLRARCADAEQARAAECALYEHALAALDDDVSGRGG